jgi:hypothetical protein
MKLLKLATGLSLSLVIFGCTTTQNISDADLKKIRTVSVAQDVAMPPYPVVIGPATNTGAFWGGIIALSIMMNSDTNPDSVEFRKHLEENKIDIKEIVRQEFLTQLSVSGKFQSVVPEGAEAKFDLTVERYGLGPIFTLSPIDKPVRPTLQLVAKLSAADGRILWQDSEYITAMGREIPSYKIDDYYSNPARTQEGFKKAAEIVAKGLLSKMGEKLEDVAAEAPTTMPFIPTTP